MEQSLVDLLSQGLPPGHPDTDLVAMIMSEVRVVWLITTTCRLAPADALPERID